MSSNLKRSGNDNLDADQKKRKLEKSVPMKYVLVTGGVLSGIGKGVIASSIGLLIKSMGLRATSIKIDPYINIDAGTMSPFEHGEVFVLDDGGEVDLDLGNYERFVDLHLRSDNNITTGKIYNRVIERERKGEYLGKTVQIIPHITDEIQAWVERVAHVCVDNTGLSPQVCVIELGGTVGDIESMPFVEAMRQMQFRLGPNNFCSIHVSLVPVVGEQKTKPTQQSVRELRALGLSPDIVICRSQTLLAPSVKEKISLFCQTSRDNVLSMPDISNLYRAPLVLRPQSLHTFLVEKFKFPEGLAKPLDLARWEELAETYDMLKNEPDDKAIHIALVGKYTEFKDAYHSVVKALQHASFAVKVRLEIDWIEASDLSDWSRRNHPDVSEKSWKTLKAAHGILVPGGFGDRGVEGKICAIQYARENKIPYLGICLGMQLAVVEVCRNVVGWRASNSTEFDQLVKHPVVIFMPEGHKTQMGGTMRLGQRTSIFNDFNSVISQLYGQEAIEERHRHRYEVNPDLVEEIEKLSDLRFVAKDETGRRMEICELKKHPYFVGVQFHPEFMSRPMRPSPPFVGLLLAASKQLEKHLQELRVKKEPVATEQNENTTTQP